MWLLLICGLLLMDAALFMAVAAGSNAENCEHLRPEASGADWGCSTVVQAIASKPSTVLVAALAITFLAPIAFAVYDDRKREGPLRPNDGH
jgi:hypothetical protein